MTTELWGAFSLFLDQEKQSDPHEGHEHFPLETHLSLLITGLEVEG